MLGGKFISLSCFFNHEAEKLSESFLPYLSVFFTAKHYLIKSSPMDFDVSDFSRDFEINSIFSVKVRFRLIDFSHCVT